MLWMVMNLSGTKQNQTLQKSVDLDFYLIIQNYNRL